MKKIKINYCNAMESVETFEGEPIEWKVRRITENNEPISDGAPIVYTEKKDGVLPEYDVRTDRFEIAIEAMDVVNGSKFAKSEAKPETTEAAETTE